MEKIDRKKMAKAILLTASLAMGMTVGQSMFNEAQASTSGGSERYQAVGEDGVNYCYCNKTGSKCQCVTG